MLIQWGRDRLTIMICNLFSPYFQNRERIDIYSLASGASQEKVEAVEVAPAMAPETGTEKEAEAYPDRVTAPRTDACDSEVYYAINKAARAVQDTGRSSSRFNSRYRSIPSIGEYRKYSLRPSLGSCSLSILVSNSRPSCSR